jgi:hypothetical protein
LDVTSGLFVRRRKSPCCPAKLGHPRGRTRPRQGRRLALVHPGTGFGRTVGLPHSRKQFRICVKLFFSGDPTHQPLRIPIVDMPDNPAGTPSDCLTAILVPRSGGKHSCNLLRMVPPGAVFPTPHTGRGWSDSETRLNSTVMAALWWSSRSVSMVTGRRRKA